MITETARIDGYRHEAFLYSGHDEFMAGVVPFVREGAGVW